MQRSTDASTPACTIALSPKAIASNSALQSPQASPRGQIPIASAAPPPPTSRDFVPWRFSDAGRHSAWMASSCRRPRNLHISGLMHRTKRVLVRSPRRRKRARAHSGNPAFRRPSINSFALDCPPRAIHADIVKAGSVSSTRAAASRVSSSRPRWAKADARQR
jgi:hypothetical protein